MRHKSLCIYHVSEKHHTRNLNRIVYEHSPTRRGASARYRFDILDPYIEESREGPAVRFLEPRLVEESGRQGATGWKRGSRRFPSAKYPSNMRLVNRCLASTLVRFNGLASSILEKSPEDICAELPDFFRILNAEGVIWSDLAARLTTYQPDIRREHARLPVAGLQGCPKHETGLKLSRRKGEKETVLSLLVEPTFSSHCPRTTWYLHSHHVASYSPRMGAKHDARALTVPLGTVIDGSGQHHLGKGIYSSSSAFFSRVHAF